MKKIFDKFTATKFIKFLKREKISEKWMISMLNEKIKDRIDFSDQRFA